MAHPQPMAPRSRSPAGITFVCNGKAIPLPLPLSVCSAESAVGTLSSTDAISGQQTYNPGALFKE
jgi:hypothetical protein